jgi:hypothetical protein
MYKSEVKKIHLQILLPQKIKFIFLGFKEKNGYKINTSWFRYFSLFRDMLEGMRYSRCGFS